MKKKPASGKPKRIPKAPAKKTEQTQYPSDLLPRDGAAWRDAIGAFFSTAEIHAFHHIETSLFEPKKMFSLYESEHGKKADAVTFPLSKGNMIIRPEATIPLLRAYAEHHLGHFSSPLKVFHFSQVARKEDSLGRSVFHEAGFHVLGDSEPFYDIQVISAAMDLLRAFKIKDAVIRVNANGCRNCRTAYREKLKKFLVSKKPDFSIREWKLVERFPENVFSPDISNKEIAEEAPTILDHLCQNCNNHLKSLLELLEDNEIPYEPDPRFLLPIERWNRIVFEIRAKSQKGGDVALFRGGRYDHLAESVLSRQIPGVGAVLIPEELIRFTREEGIQFHSRQKAKVFFIVVGDKAKKVSVKLMNILRASGIIVEEALGKQSFKAQLKSAEKSKATFVLIVGQKEAFEDTVIVRNIASGAQETITTVNLAEEVKRRLKS